MHADVRICRSSHTVQGERQTTTKEWPRKAMQRHANARKRLRSMQKSNRSQAGVAPWQRLRGSVVWASCVGQLCGPVWPSVWSAWSTHVTRRGDSEAAAG